MRREFRTLDIVKYLALAMILSALPISLVSIGVLPSGAIQLGALSPSIAAFVFAFANGGKDALFSLLKRGIAWRAPTHIWFFALFFLLIPAIVSVYLTGLITGNAFNLGSLPPLVSVIPMIVVLTILAGFGEEYGWRGYLMPKLMNGQNAVVASLIVGLAWGVWHMPLFFTPGSVQQEWAAQAGMFSAIAGYTLFCIVWSVQYAWIYVHSKGSVLLAAIFHGAGNAWIGGYIDVYRGDVTGVFVFTVVMAVCSLILYLAFGKHLGGRKDQS